MEYRINPDDLTLGEVDDLEGAAGASVAEIFGPAGMRAKHLIAVVWVLGRRDNPEFSLDDARAVKVGELVVEGGEADPTSAAG